MDTLINHYKPVIVAVFSAVTIEYSYLLNLSELGTSLVQLLIGILTLTYITIKTIRLWKKR